MRPQDPTIRRGEPLHFFPTMVEHGITPAIANEIVRSLSLPPPALRRSAAPAMMRARAQSQVSCAPFMDTLWFCFGNPLPSLPEPHRCQL